MNFEWGTQILCPVRRTPSTWKAKT